MDIALGVVLFGLSLYLIEKFKLNIFEVKPIKRTHLLYMLCYFNWSCYLLVNFINNWSAT